MFVTILFGDDRREVLNINCQLIHFIRHVKQSCGLDVKECVELMDSSGSVMNLEDKQHSEDSASSVLVHRHFYFLLHVCRDEKIGERKYVSLLNNSSLSHPELAEMLRKLSNPNKEQDGRKRKGWNQRRLPVGPTGSRNLSVKDKRHKRGTLFV